MTKNRDNTASKQQNGIMPEEKKKEKKAGYECRGRDPQKSGMASRVMEEEKSLARYLPREE